MAILMKRLILSPRSLPLFIVLLLSPYIVGFGPSLQDTSSTHIGLAGGTGSYAVISRDCSGHALRVNDHPFSEAAVSVDHYTPLLHIGLTGGSIPPDAASELFDIEGPGYFPATLSVAPLGRVYYTVPTIGLNTSWFGLDVGLVVPFGQQGYRFRTTIPAGSLRLGGRDDWHFLFRMAADSPLITGGPGVYNLGFGWTLGDPRYPIWVGVGGGPYDGLQYGTQVEFPLGGPVSLRLAGSIGGRETMEYGLSAKTRISF